MAEQIAPNVSDSTQREFLTALAHFCECSVDDLGLIVGAPCPGHAAMDTDTNWLNRLCFVREIVVQLQVEELTHGTPIEAVA